MRIPYGLEEAHLWCDSLKRRRPLPATQPKNYDTLTLPSITQMIASTFLVIPGLVLPYTFLVSRFQDTPVLMLVLMVVVPIALIPVYRACLNWRRLSWALLGEFWLRPWHIAASAQVRRVEYINSPAGNALAQQTDHLLGVALPRFCYLAEVEVQPTWGCSKVVSYVLVDKVFARAAYNGMSISVRYQESRLDRSRLRVRSAL